MTNLKAVLMLMGLILMLLLLGVLMTSCKDPGSKLPYAVHVNTVPLPDGRTVICVTYYGDGITCDWAGLRSTNAEER